MSAPRPTEPAPAAPAAPVAVEALMARLAAGDPSSVFVLLEQRRGPLVGTVRSILSDLHRHDLLADAELVDGLVIDAALVLFELAPGWRPGGAAPWRWAHRAIRAAIVTEIGHPVDDVDPDALEPLVTDPAPVTDVDLDALARAHPAIAAYLGRVGRVAHGRNRDVFVEYEIQQACGDPSPAHTVADLYGLSPANVRQIVSRTRRALEAELLGAELRVADMQAPVPPPAAPAPPAALSPALSPAPERAAAVAPPPPAAPPGGALAESIAAPAITTPGSRATWRRRARALLRLALDAGRG